MLGIWLEMTTKTRASVCLLKLMPHGADYLMSVSFASAHLAVSTFTHMLLLSGIQ